MNGAPSWRRLSIGAAAAMFLCMALGRFSYSAMVPAIIEAGRADPVTAGYIGGANLAAFLLGALISTMTARSLPVRTLLAIAVWTACAGLFASALEFGPIWLGILRALIGLMTGIVMVRGLALAATSAPPAKRAVAASYVFMGVGLGILFTGTAVPLALRIGHELARTGTEPFLLASPDVRLSLAWLTVAIAGFIAATVAQWGLHHANTAAPANTTGADQALPEQALPNRWALTGLAAASFAFSFGITPHTLYWVDFIARRLDLGYDVASAHWMAVGIFAILGPVLVAALAGRTGNAAATVVSYVVLAIGIAAPWFAQNGFALALSTAIFGMQPGVSTMLAARARDLTTAREAQSIMRIMIVANGLGSACGGVTVPLLLDLTGSHGLLFLAGGCAFAIGAVFCFPWSGNRPSAN